MLSRVVFSALLLSGRSLLWETLLGPSLVIMVSVLLLSDTYVTAVGCAAWYNHVPVVIVVFIILFSSKSLLLEAVLSLEVFQQQIVVSRLLFSGRLLP